jgi:hypothetical protein
MATPKINSCKTFWMELMDSMFILFLCFATLFTAMVIKEKIGSELSYIIDLKTLGAVILSLIIYLAYLLYHSDQEFKIAISSYYKEQVVNEIIELKEVEVI